MCGMPYMTDLPVGKPGVFWMDEKFSEKKFETFFNEVLEHFNARLTEKLTKESIQWAEILKNLSQSEYFFDNENRECA